MKRKTVVEFLITLALLMSPRTAAPQGAINNATLEGVWQAKRLELEVEGTLDVSQIDGNWIAAIAEYRVPVVVTAARISLELPADKAISKAILQQILHRSGVTGFSAQEITIRQSF